ncbi:hypothetical protein [Citrobacter amalonaticus]|uniref:hypothetical protein n=1 Tax=Citrobacter amalonaticus TaxID=35703 RepID=UPI00300D9350
MKSSGKTNVTANEANKNAVVLRCDEDFEHWYLKQFDYTMFTDMEIQQAMEEVRPEKYPCIPLIQDGGNEVTYLGEDLVTFLFRKLCTVTLSPQ